MNFLAPLFLLAAAGIAGPVLFHLIRRTTKERAIFSSLMFLSPTPPRLTRRSRLENLLLLALRCMVLCLLALAFARPFIKAKAASSPVSAGPSCTVVLMDTSASMRRAGLWAEARAKAADAARAAAPIDEMAVLTFDRQVHSLVSFEEWRNTPPGDRPALVSQKLSTDSPGWAGTRAGQALMDAAELLGDASAKDATAQNEIVLVSDLQESSHLDALQSYEWPKTVKLNVVLLHPRPASNASLQLIIESPDAEAKAASSGQARVRVNNAADSKREQFKVGWGGGTNVPIDVYVPPGQSRAVTLPPPAPGAGLSQIVLTGDDEEFDNAIYTAPPERATRSVFYFGSDAEDDPKRPLYFVRKAFQDTRSQSVQLVVQAPGVAAPGTALAHADLVLIADPLPTGQVSPIRDWVTSGGKALMALGNAGFGPVAAALIGQDRLSVQEAVGFKYAMFSEIDFRHPLFAPFADPRFADFTKIRFWKYRRMDLAELPGARTLAKFDTGDPALVEVRVGKGRVFLLAAGWHPEDSQLALSTKFVPFLYTLLEQTGAPAPPPPQVFVGAPLDFAAFSKTANANATVRTPAGKQIPLGDDTSRFEDTMIPGLYELSTASTRTRFVVNLDPAESKLSPVPADELERLGLPVNLRSETAAAGERQRMINLKNSELENRQKLWRWLIVATLGMLLLETVVAGRTARISNVPEPANP